MRAQAGDVAAVESRPCPRVGFWKPESALTSVVLPAPFGPIRPRISPLLSYEVDAVDGVNTAEVDLEAAGLEQLHPVR